MVCVVEAQQLTDVIEQHGPAGATRRQLPAPLSPVRRSRLHAPIPHAAVGTADSAALAQALVSVSRVRTSIVARTVARAASVCRGPADRAVLVMTAAARRHDIEGRGEAESVGIYGCGTRSARMSQLRNRPVVSQSPGRMPPARMARSDCALDLWKAAGYQAARVSQSRKSSRSEMSTRLG